MGARTLLQFAVAIWLCLGTTASAASPPSTLEDVVILANGTLTVGPSVQQATGQLVVNSPAGIATLRRSFSAFTDTQLVANSLVIRGGRRVAGPRLFDLFTNGPVDSQTIIDGDGPTPVSLPLFTFPTAPVVTPGTASCPAPGRRPGDCNVRSLGGPVIIQPGNYGNIRVSAGGLAYFAGGVYNVKSLVAGGHAGVYFNGTTTLNVANNAHFGQRVVFGPPVEVMLSGRCIVMNVAGNAAMKFSGNDDVTAMIIAPHSAVKLGAFGIYRGQFVGDSVLVGRNALLTTLPALLAPCP